MKALHVFFIVLLALGMAACGSKEESSEDQPVTEGYGKIEFEELEFDFGQIKQGEIVTHTFKFRNVGEADLIIKSANASCGCTVPTWTKKPIASGEMGEIVIKFDTSGRKGIQNKTVTIVANTEEGNTKIKFTAEVVTN